MAHKLKLISCRSLIAYALTIALIWLFVTDNSRLETSNNWADIILYIEPRVEKTDVPF